MDRYRVQGYVWSPRAGARNSPLLFHGVYYKPLIIMHSGYEKLPIGVRSSRSAK